jgi:pyruvate dehydrogenase E2 component (dihydrolipoamide acetyltransferase)
MFTPLSFANFLAKGEALILSSITSLALGNCPVGTDTVLTSSTTDTTTFSLFSIFSDTSDFSSITFSIDAILKEEASKAKVIEEKSEVSEKIENKEKVVVSVVEEVKTVSVPTGQFPKARDVMDDSIKASPLARKLAKERGVNIQFIKGTGQDGRIVKRDIDNYQGGGVSINGKESHRDEPVSQMRKVIAQRLGESKFSAPHFYLTVSVNMDQVIEARKSINKAIEPSKISYNDLIVKAAAISLKEHPQVNSSWLEDIIRYNDHVHIGVAVAVPEGLLVPVIRFADGKSLTQIGSEVKETAQWLY